MLTWSSGFWLGLVNRESCRRPEEGGEEGWGYPLGFLPQDRQCSATEGQGISQDATLGFVTAPPPCCLRPRGEAHIPCSFPTFPTFFPHLCKLSLPFPIGTCQEPLRYSLLLHYYLLSFPFSVADRSCWSSIVSILTCSYVNPDPAESTFDAKGICELDQR